MPTIIIVGAGFSGTVTAVHLLRHGFGENSRLFLINRSGAMARGVAYGTTSDHHVLNVPAGSMSAFEESPDDFVEFLKGQGIEAERETFVCRRHYGSYLEWRLRDAIARATSVACHRITDEVLDVEPAPDGEAVDVRLGDGSMIRADRVVLAVGNYPPAMPAVSTDVPLEQSPRYVADPWEPGALTRVDPRGPALFLGSGLTMIDIALELRALGMPLQGVALSRHGLLPSPHRTTAAPYPSPAVAFPPALRDGAPRIRRYVSVVRRHVRSMTDAGLDWRDVIASLRSATPGLWQSLALEERQRFLRHVRPFWEVHRHRVAPRLHEAFVELLDEGALRVLAGRLVHVRHQPESVSVRIRPRGRHAPLDLTVGTIINCTGPANDTRSLHDELVQGLRRKGLLQPDSLGLGIECTKDGVLLGRERRPSLPLYYVGPFLRARDWEATAVPELRRHVHRLAAHLVETLASAGRRSAPIR